MMSYQLSILNFNHFISLQANIEFGYALCDIITELGLLVSQTELPDAVSSYLIDK